MVVISGPGGVHVLETPKDIPIVEILRIFGCENPTKEDVAEFGRRLLGHLTEEEAAETERRLLDMLSDDADRTAPR